MGLEELRRDILAQAKAQADASIASAKATAEEALAQARAAAAERQSAATEETERLLAQLEQRELASAALEAKKLAMSAKKTVLDDVFEQALRSLVEAKPDERKALLASLLKRASAEIAVATVYCNARDAELISGHKAVHMHIAGGLIAENKEGTMRADYSFETMLAEVRERSLEELGRVVFG